MKAHILYRRPPVPMRNPNGRSQGSPFLDYSPALEDRLGYTPTVGIVLFDPSHKTKEEIRQAVAANVDADSVDEFYWVEIDVIDKPSTREFFTG